MNDSPSLDWLISVDDHILEPPHLWVDRVAAKDRDKAPHMEVLLHHYLYGKPKEHVEHSGTVTLAHLLDERLRIAKERARAQRSAGGELT